VARNGSRSTSSRSSTCEWLFPFPSGDRDEPISQGWHSPGRSKSICSSSKRRSKHSDDRFAQLMSMQMRDTVELPAAGVYLLERFFSRSERAQLFRSWCVAFSSFHITRPINAQGWSQLDVAQRRQCRLGRSVRSARCKPCHPAKSEAEPVRILKTQRSREGTSTTFGTQIRPNSTHLQSALTLPCTWHPHSPDVANCEQGRRLHLSFAKLARQ
jgi:hypothetical protein